MSNKPRIKINMRGGVPSIGSPACGELVDDHKHGPEVIPVGRPVMTSHVIAISDDGKFFETRNTIYEIADAKPKVDDTTPVAPDRPVPDWRFAPEWADYRAMDQSGDWHWFENKPDPVEDGWESDGNGQRAYVMYDGWEKTLQKRPSEFVQNLAGYFYSGPGYAFTVRDHAMGEKIVRAICSIEDNVDAYEFTASDLRGLK